MRTEIPVAEQKVSLTADSSSRRTRSVAKSASMPLHTPFSITNATAVMPDGLQQQLTIVVRDGLIYRIDAVHASAARRIDCGGDYLLPGLIEVHTDNLERHIEPRPGTFWSSDRAVLAHDAELAAAGITTVCDAITIGADTGEPARQRAYLEAIESADEATAQGLFKVQHLLHLRCELASPGLREWLRLATQKKAPELVSLMEHVPGRGQWQDVAQFRRYYARRYNLSAAQLDELIARRQADADRFATTNRAAVIERAAACGSVLASHDDTLLADVDRSAEAGCTICEFPTSLEAARGARERGMHIIAGAPNIVCGGSHAGNVAASALAEGGLIDILSSDYCPSSLLQAVFQVAHSRTMSLSAAVALASGNVARALNLGDRGVIEEGKRADLVRVRNTTRGPIVVSAWCAGRQVA